MTALLERLDSERRFHDEQARSRQRSFDRGDASLIFHDDDWLDHETWIRPAVDSLGDLQHKRVLDLGCGHGMAATVLARCGAVVSAVDLSPEYVNEARRRAVANGVVIRAVTGSGEELPFEDQEFDAVWGNAILHHLELPRALSELRRVLKPGGKAVFCEPWGGNPLFRLLRNHMPYPGKHRTADEKPLEPADLEVIRDWFPSMTWQGHQIFGALRRVSPLFTFRRLDNLLLPRFSRWARYAVLQIEC